MRTGLPVGGVTPRSNGSPEGDHLIDVWNQSVLEGRALERKRRGELARVGVTRVIPNDGWVERINGTPVRIPFDHPYGEYASLAVGDRVAIGSILDRRPTMVDVYQVIRIEPSMLHPSASKVAVEYVRSVPW